MVLLNLLIEGNRHLKFLKKHAVFYAILILEPVKSRELKDFWAQ